MAASVQARVKEIVCEQLGVSAEEVTPEASFIEDLGGGLFGYRRVSDGAGRRI